MDTVSILGIVSSVASVVGLLLPTQAKYPRILHAVYGLFIAILSGVIVSYSQEHSRIHNVERSASVLVKDFDHEYTQAGFVQAALAFLEKNKDLYPDAYIRGQKLYAECDCRGTSGMVGLAFELQGLLRGIGTLEGKRE